MIAVWDSMNELQKPDMFLNSPFEGERGILAEIFTSFQGEGPFLGRKQIFVRTAGCNLSCSYCDTSQFRTYRVPCCRSEAKPDSGRFVEVLNPISPEAAMKLVCRLRSPGLHSVSITGGEPLCQSLFVKGLAMECAAKGLPVYLETNGFSFNRFVQLIDWIDFASVDLKLPSHRPCPAQDWNDLLKNEQTCLKAASDAGVTTIAKIVILDSTTSEEVEKACTPLEGRDIILVIQPATGPDRPSPGMLAHFHQKASAHMKDVVVIPQTHKIMGVL